MHNSNAANDPGSRSSWSPVDKALDRQSGDSDWKLGTWNCRSLNFIGSTGSGFGIVALQEVCWTESIVRMFRGNHTIYQSCGNTRELGTAFIVMKAEVRDRLVFGRRMNVKVEDQWPILLLQHNKRAQPTLRKH